ncbi:MAG: endonuclease/exonuclease/phosphatase family protein [Opitutaceae bacterium]|jgi:endonuclease/exonuclease/phosphatase family metal-dependent hydrolase|nr:endonuclease/exonuclease/phosphatase family protein [Opitutaceae bacterium]
MIQSAQNLRRVRPRAARAAGFIRRARLAIVFAGALCAAPPGFSAPEPAPVRVLTFNVLGSYLGADKAGGEETARVKRWEKRRPLVIEVMREHPDGSGPYDFIGTQETGIDTRDASRDQTRVLAKAMAGHGSLFAPCTGPRLRRYSLSNMIFWRKDRWEIDPGDHGTFWLSGTPDEPGSDDWSDEGRPESRRCVTHGLFHETGPAGRRTGRRVYFYNTHLFVHSQAARDKAAVLIMERIANRRDRTAAVILTGDMNSRQWSAPVLYFQGREVSIAGKKRAAPLALRDTYAAIYPGQAHVTVASQKEVEPPLVGTKIDYIFASDGFKTTGARRIETHRGDLWPSDHYPFEAVLEFAGEKFAGGGN